jgi:Icc-related predicted phosphoesterase
VTHEPPAGILDLTPDGEHVGCADLRQAVDRVKPRLHVFGHIHHGYGVKVVGPTRFVNASVCDEAYAPSNRPVDVDL